MEWMPIESAPEEGTLAVLFSADRTYTDARTGDVCAPMGNPRDQGCMMDIAAYFQGRWFEVYTGHDCFEEWRGEDVPTHYLPLPTPPETNDG